MKEEGIEEKKKVPWPERKIVYPWDLSRFPYPLREKQTVLEFLRKAKYPLEKLQKKPESDKLIRAVNGVMQKVLNRQWVLVVSTRAWLLHSMATVIPPCFALTAMDPCRNVTTAYLIDLFMAKAPEDMWEDDYAAETYAQIVKTGLLMWTGVNEIALGSKMHASRFADLLSARWLKNYPTVFTAYSLDSLNKESILASIEEALGTTAAGIIKEKAVLMEFVLEEKTMKAEKIAL